jgi:trimeric autotransporter adhesin
MSRKFLEDVEITAGVKITSGSPGAGKVLTSDLDGDATWESPGAGSGDVVGPGVSTDNALARFNGTGNVIQNSNAILSDAGDLTTDGTVIQIVTGTGDSWGAYLQAIEASDNSNVGAYTDTSFFDITVTNVNGVGVNQNLTLFSTSHALRFDTNGNDALLIKTDQTIQLYAYGAGVLTSDGSGNITSVAGGGISESLAIAYSIALG